MKDMIRITADEKIPFLEGVLEPFATISYMPGNQIYRNIAMQSDALLVRTRTRCDSELLYGTPVKFVGTATIGFDHIDTDFCEKNKIRWTNAPGCNASSVQQYIAAALMKISAESGFSLKGMTLGIVGVGNVGSRVQYLAEALGMRVMLNDPPREREEGKKGFTDLEHLLSESDIVTLHVPLNLVGTDKTFHLLNEKTFSMIKRGAWLINTSRGEVVDTDDVKDALAGDGLAGIIVDVWEREPEFDIPLMHMAFLATPHIAGYSVDGKANGTAMIVNSLCKYFDIDIQNWYPDNVPVPPEPDILINGNGKSDEYIIREAVFHTYNPDDDDIKLRLSPVDFEMQRSEYPLRREFSSYSVKLSRSSKEAGEMIDELGFKIIS